MVRVPPEMIDYVVSKMVELDSEATDVAAELKRSRYREQASRVLGALAEANFVPVWAKISTTGKNSPGQAWEASISRRSAHGSSAAESLSELWAGEALGYIPHAIAVIPRP